MLADTADLGAQAGHMAGRCQATGLDPRSYRGVIGASLALGCLPAQGLDLRWADDRELITAICDLLDEIADRWAEYVKLRHEAATERARSLAQRATTTNFRDRDTLSATIADCTTCLETLESLAPRLTAAARRLSDAPTQLGETYAEVYRLLATGRQMPHNGRWITGEHTS